ncbi:MAG TPA: hypothetical protein DCR46_06625, partial [Cytophagales bacterium]|nr:hypothetical protein [Cytophagales bacterium]
SNFPTPVPGVWSVTNNSRNCNNAALKFDLGRVIARFETFDSLKAIPSQYGCAPITFLLKNKSTGATNYKWDVGAGVVTFKKDSIFIKFPNRGFQNITLIAFDTSICNLTDTMRATINSGDARVDFVPDIIQCGLAPVIPKIKLYTPWAKVRWTPSEGLSDSTIANPTISFIGKDMVYYISVTDDTLCMKFDTLSVKIRDPNPTARFVIMDSSKTVEKYSFCHPNSVFLKNKSTYYDYMEWKKDHNNLFVNVDSFYQIFPALGKTKYELFIYDSVCARGAMVQKTLTMSKPFPTYPSNVVMCQNNPISVKVIGEPGFRYLWQPTTLFADPTAPSQTFIPKQNGKIDITVTDTIGCTDKGTFRYSIISTDDPIQEKEFTFCRQKDKFLEIITLPFINYTWQPGAYTVNPLRITQEGTYYFQGTDANGCVVKDTITVLNYCPPQLHVPSAFSPNDDGLNDMFQVFGNDIVAFDIKIFNRWGELIYQSNDFNFKWDGKYKGETVPIETYPYVISYQGAKYKDQELNNTFSGNVTVVR